MQLAADFVLPTEAIRQSLQLSNAQRIKQYPFLAPNVFDRVKSKLSDLNMQAGVWDKQPCQLHATCTVHMQRALAELTVCDTNFRLIAVESVRGAANEYVLQQTLLSARQHGVIDIGVRHGLYSKTICTPRELRKRSKARK